MGESAIGEPGGRSAEPARDDAVTGHLAPGVDPAALPGLAELVGLGRLVEVVDVGANPLDGEAAPYLPLLTGGVARVTGFEPQAEALAALRASGGDRERYLGHAVGDGDVAELRICASGGFSSLLEPDVEQLAVLTDFPRLAEVRERAPLVTARLDDIPEIERADLLKLDVQGGEAAVLGGAARVVATSVAVQVEVGFHRLYEGAPTFADVDAVLRAAGFAPHAFVSQRTWPLAPVQWADPLQHRSRHLVEADVLYTRDLARLDLATDDQLAAGVIVAAGAYGAFGLGLVFTRELVRRGVLPAEAEAGYRGLVTEAAR